MDSVAGLFEAGSSSGTISSYIGSNSNTNFYGGGYDWLDAPLMQTHMMSQLKYQTYPVGIGMGTDYSFMDRVARMGRTADGMGQSARGSGNPAEYEQRLRDIFTTIIGNPRVRLVD